MNALQYFSLKGKVVVLTGGAGLYGRGPTSCLASAGATLVIASRGLAALRAVAEEECAFGWTAEAEELDQGEESSVLALRDRLLARHGRIDGLVNNAVLRPMKGSDDSAAHWEESMRVNSTGLFVITRAFGEVMARQQSGSIVNIGSIQGMVGANLWLYEGTNIGTVPDFFS